MRAHGPFYISIGLMQKGALTLSLIKGALEKKNNNLTKHNNAILVEKERKKETNKKIPRLSDQLTMMGSPSLQLICGQSMVN